MDPDLGQDIVSCGFVKRLQISPSPPLAAERDGASSVSFELRLTTPACPIKEQFRADAARVVGELPWVAGGAGGVSVSISSDPRQPSLAVPPSVDGEGGSGGGNGEVEGRPGGLSRVRHVIAVSSCKGGVGKSTVAVNLAFTLLQMGARGVGLFDADVYGPSLPTMVTPVGDAVLGMDPVTRMLTPVTARATAGEGNARGGGGGGGGGGAGGEGGEEAGVKCVSFGWAGQGAAIMRGPMASGVVAQLLSTSDWGDLDYLVVDFPPGTGDIQLTLCQTVAFDAAVVGEFTGEGNPPPPSSFRSFFRRLREPPPPGNLTRVVKKKPKTKKNPTVTTPQKLAYVDVAKGVRMFARVGVPCVAVAENMSSFRGDDGKVYYPFGAGAGDRIAREFGVPRVVRFPIDAGLAAAGDCGVPLVVSDPAGDVAEAMMELGGAVVREVAVGSVGGGRARGGLDFDAATGEFLYSPPRGGIGASSSASYASPSSSSSSSSSAPSSASSSSSPSSPPSSPSPSSEQLTVRLSAASVRDSDRSAAAIDEWTGAPLRPAASSLPAEALIPSEAPRRVGNYAVQISWGDGVSQLSTFEQLGELAAAARAEGRREGRREGAAKEASGARVG